MKKRLKKQKKGISLIVLVITIVVMIILATAIILSLINSGIIGKANKAKTDSNEANAKEYVGILEAEWNLMSEAEKSKEPYNGSFAIYANSKIKETGYDKNGVAVGEDGTIYTGLSSSAMEAVKQNIQLGAVVEGYILTEKSYSTDGSEHSGTEEDGTAIIGVSQTLTTNTGLTWKYVGIGEDGNILIASDMPKEVPDTSNIELGYQGGYLKGPEILNIVCDKLYTTTKGTARNINIDDVNRLLKYSGTKGLYWNTAGKKVPIEEALTIGEIGEILGTELSDVITPDGINTWKEISKYKSDRYSIIDTSSNIKNEAGRKLVYYDKEYWLASPCAYARFDEGYAGFLVRCVGSSIVGAYFMFYSDGGVNSGIRAVRPIVSLSSNIQFEYDEITNKMILN